LAAARELLKEGHAPVVFEQMPSVGGVWIFDEKAVDARPLGVGEPATQATTSSGDPAANATERQAPPLPWTDTVHGSMYCDLRTNLPREVMGYLDYPFSADQEDEEEEELEGGGNDDDASLSPRLTPKFPYRAEDPRRYPGHAEVLRYLEAYADAFDLTRHFRLGRRVVRATPAAGNSSPGWRVSSVAVSRDPSTGRLRWRQEQEEAEEELFDALVVANGHYALPNLPAVAVSPSARLFPGQQLHSHNYRSPAPYAGRRVVVVGASNSGLDVAEEIAAAGAELVVVSSRGGGGGGGAAAAADGKQQPRLERRGMLSALRADGSCAFDDGLPAVERVDAVIYATGYRYSFDFLDEAFYPPPAAGDTANANADGALLRWREEAGRVAPLFLHMFPATGGLAPRLSFLGLPWKVVPFPLMQLQARLVAKLLTAEAGAGAGDAVANPPPLPSEAEMLAALAEEDARRAAAGASLRHTHVLDGDQWAYNAELLRRCGEAASSSAAAAVAAIEGEAPVPSSWRERMYGSARDNKRAGGNYRDRWEDEVTAAEAAEEFRALRRRWREEAAAAAAAAKGQRRRETASAAAS
jgi:hypothetical protein